jgi:hypothetical protein
MVGDIRKGAVLPPVVIGVILDAKTFKELHSEHPSKTTLLQTISEKHLSIIDGMQRRAALLEAGSIDSEVYARDMRVEFWVAQNARALVYQEVARFRHECTLQTGFFRH